jgi:hypothetical protein
MQVQVEIGFDQLVDIARNLSSKQWDKLKLEIEKEAAPSPASNDMEAFLLSAPTFTKKQLDAIDKTRKAINQWRTK